MGKLTDKYKLNIERVGQLCFYLGLLLEILIVIVDKSSYINPIEGQLFRLAFLLFAVKLSLTRYTAKEWAAILIAGFIAGLCYLASTRDEAVRVVVFVAAVKGVDVKKALKTVFFCTLAGMIVLAVLAFAGILGEVYDAGAGYGVKEGVPRLCLGVGNSNALACMIWALMTLGIYLCHEKMKLWHYGLLAVLTYLTYRATVTRTTFLVMAFTLVSAVMLTCVKKLREWKPVYIGGILGVLGGLGFSVYAAYISDWYDFMPDWVVKVDRFLTGRIASIYAFKNGGGVLENWKLFGDPSYVEYFDMGYVRLFFWYGMIPAAGCMLLLCLLLWECRRRKDYMGFVMILSFAVYTVVEAHFVSVYIGRNYGLMLLGAYWPFMLRQKKDRQAFWWNFTALFLKGCSKRGEINFEGGHDRRGQERKGRRIRGRQQFL